MARIPSKGVPKGEAPEPPIRKGEVKVEGPPPPIRRPVKIGDVN